MNFLRTVVCVIVGIVYCSLYWATCNETISMAGGTEQQVCMAIMKLQPAHTPVVAAAYAGIFYEAGTEYSLDPLLLVAISRRESSLMPHVIGKVGEIGLMQVHGAALLGRPSKCTKQLNTESCQIYTGTQWLAQARERCPGTPWRWVTMYGKGKCLSEEESREIDGTRRARRYYVEVGGTEWPE